MKKNQWRKIPLHQLPIDIIDGDRSSRYPKRDDFQGEGVVFLNSTNIVDNRLSLRDCNRISEQKYSGIKKGRVKHLDVVMTTRGSIGKVALVNKKKIEKGIINAQMLLIRAKPSEINPIYLFYVTCGENFQKEIKNYSSGSAQPQIPIRDLRRVPIPYPPLETQRKIASILSAYDDLIENNLRRIEILEEMARLIYREWFVHFRFPGHETVRMVDSTLGKIPEGWEIVPFERVFKVRYGKELPLKKICSSGKYPVYGAGSIIGFYDKKITDKKVVLITCRGNGSGTVWRTRGPAFVTNNSFVLNPNKDFEFFSYFFAELHLKNANIDSVVGGSAQPQITIRDLSRLKIVVPQEKEVRRFSKYLAPSFDLLDKLYLKNQSLQKTRDLLLSKLVSGEVDVSELDIYTGRLEE